ncbi:MAG: spermidine synthase [Sulfolobales archaeon]|nr:spermidine synthase [Sulfolobales archaeon]MCX8198693.1 spermidine synthase [Sulfolobales archaeon]MDW8169766.1 spermidine synthase [Desulfurococcaceae archaeon]
MSFAGRPILFEPTSHCTATLFIFKNVIAHRRTKYQEFIIADLEGFGRSLIIDGYIQSSEADEVIYHESLVHPAMVTHPNPRRVLIIGGGEGATLREVLKHSSVERAVMVDIDGELVEAAIQHLETMHKGSFFSKKAEVIIDDGYQYVLSAPRSSFDVAIIDLTDPYSSEQVKRLYNRDFYEEVSRVLSNDGILVTQAGNAFFFPEEYTWIVDNLKRVFPIVLEYEAWIPVTGYSVDYVIGSKLHDPRDLSIEEVEHRLKNRGAFTNYYNGRIHLGFIYKSVTKPLAIMPKTHSLKTRES